MLNKYPHILRFVQKTPWAIMPDKGMEILDFLSLKAAGVMFTQAEIEARSGNGVGRPQARSSGDIAVLTLYGVVAQRLNENQSISPGGDGGTSVERFTQQLRAAVENPSIKAIVINVDSPGGSVYGVAELASEIYAARSKKYIVAVANSLAASAAYWIAAAASELFVTPGGEVGSVGVYMMHADYSAQLEQEGVKTTFISAGKYKTEANPFQPLSEEAKNYLQSQVDQYNSQFVSSLAKYRGVTTSFVNENFGQGRVLMAKEAKEKNMVDGIATLDDILTKLGANTSAPQRASAEEPRKRYASIERKRLELM